MRERIRATPNKHLAMMATDIVSFGHPSRSDSVQLYLRSALYKILAEAFDTSGVPWNSCHREDRGDGLLIIVPRQVPETLLVDPMLFHLRAIIRRHNKVTSEAARIRLRIAVHAGYVEMDQSGVAGSAVNHIFRLVEASPFKEALHRSEQDLGVITSDRFYDDVVRHGLNMLDPAGFTPVRVQAKESATRGWVYIPPQGAQRLPAQSDGGSVA